MLSILGGPVPWTLDATHYAKRRLPVHALTVASVMAAAGVLVRPEAPLLHAALGSRSRAPASAAAVFTDQGPLALVEHLKLEIHRQAGALIARDRARRDHAAALHGRRLRLDVAGHLRAATAADVSSGAHGTHGSLPDLQGRTRPVRAGSA